jgi:hypothetical protein
MEAAELNHSLKNHCEKKEDHNSKLSAGEIPREKKARTQENREHAESGRRRK